MHLRKRHTGPLSLPSGWCTSRWRLKSGPTLRLESNAYGLADQIDQTWPDARPEDAPHRRWSWKRIFTRARVGLVGLEAETGEATFAVALKRRYRLKGPPPCLRLDFIEVAPHRCNAGVGTLALGLVAEFALHSEREGMLLGALDVPSTIGFYRDLGGQIGEKPFDWLAPEGTMPVYFNLDRLRALKAWADERRL